jgi:hypothetical protein
VSFSATYAPPEARALAAKVEKVLLRKKARRDVEAFKRYVYELPTPPHHALWCSALQGVADGLIKRLVLIAPPGHAKSTITSIVFPTWVIGRRPYDSIIEVGTTDRLAQLFGDAVRTTIKESAAFRQVFPTSIPDEARGWAREGFFVQDANSARPRSAKDPAGTFVGAEGAIIGRRANGLIIDDPVDEATARSEILLEARKLWLNRSAFSRLNGVPGAWAVVAGTVWTDDDVVSTYRDGGEFVVIEMHALSGTQRQEAEVWVPDGIDWRPERYVEIA